MLKLVLSLVTAATIGSWGWFAFSHGLEDADAALQSLPAGETAGVALNNQAVAVWSVKEPGPAASLLAEARRLRPHDAVVARNARLADVALARRRALTMLWRGSLVAAALVAAVGLGAFLSRAVAAALLVLTLLAAAALAAWLVDHPLASSAADVLRRVTRTAQRPDEPAPTPTPSRPAAVARVAPEPPPAPTSTPSARTERTRVPRTTRLPAVQSKERHTPASAVAPLSRPARERNSRPARRMSSVRLDRLVRQERAARAARAARRTVVTSARASETQETSESSASPPAPSAERTLVRRYSATRRRPWRAARTASAPRRPRWASSVGSRPCPKTGWALSAVDRATGLRFVLAYVGGRGSQMVYVCADFIGRHRWRREWNTTFAFLRPTTMAERRAILARYPELAFIKSFRIRKDAP